LKVQLTLPDGQFWLESVTMSVALFSSCQRSLALKGEVPSLRKNDPRPA